LAVGDVGGDRDPAERGGGRLGRRAVDVDNGHARTLGGEDRGDPAADAARGAGDHGDLARQILHRRPNILALRTMQRFPESDAKYAYSPEHASIGSVEPGEVFEVESVEGYSGYFRSPEDFDEDSYAAAEAHKWAVVGPITVAGAETGGAVAVTIHDVEITTPGVVTYGAYSREVDPYEWWDDETAADVYAIQDGLVHFDEHTKLPIRPLIGCLAVQPAEGEVNASLQG